MTRYTLRIKESARKELAALNDLLFARIDAKIAMLATNPRPFGYKELRGYGRFWRIRIGDYRSVTCAKPADCEGVQGATVILTTCPAYS